MNLLNKVLISLFGKMGTGFIYFGHGITADDITVPRYSKLHLDINHLERIIVFWQNLGFRFISFDELSQIVLQGKRPKYPWIHLTFDDGYKNNLTVALPLLASKNIPFTIFISVSNMLEQKPLDNNYIYWLIKNQKSKSIFESIAKKFLFVDILKEIETDAHKIFVDKFKYLAPQKKQELTKELLDNTDTNSSEMLAKFPFEEILTSNDLFELSKSKFVTIGSHGYNHFILTTLSEEEIEFEMAESKRVLEKIISKEVKAYCYPNGTKKDYNSMIEKACQRLGYDTAFTTTEAKWNRKYSLFAIPRIAISRELLLKRAIKLLLFK
jgi:peptidoglycan/xylan/chitin deacetylase (PgdA/CDA1 family)